MAGIPTKWLWLRTVVHFLPLLLLFSCARSEGVRFYTLSPIAPTHAAEATSVPSGPIISLGPVRVPAYVDRPQIVTRHRDRVMMAEFDRWAGSLEENIATVLQRNLLSMLQPHGLHIVSYRSRIDAQLNVPVHILTLDAVPGRDISCTAQWVVRKEDDKEAAEVLEASFRQPIAGTGYNDVVEAINKVLGDLSVRIAESILQGLRSDPEKTTS